MTGAQEERLVVTVEHAGGRWFAAARHRGVVWTVQQGATRAEALAALAAALRVTGHPVAEWPS
jgi:hypothetical protein